MMQGLSQEQMKWVTDTKDKLLKKVTAEVDRLGNGIPFIPIEGHYRDLMMPGGLHWWCNGFWPGMLWQLVHSEADSARKVKTDVSQQKETDAARQIAADVFQQNDEQSALPKKEEFLLQTAVEAIDRRLAEALSDGKEAFDHDVGFLYLLSSGAEYAQTGNEDAKQTLLLAADILKERFQKKGNYILAWNEGSNPEMDTSGMMIADCMMNISLLYIASELTGKDSYRITANAHADTSLKYLLREDGSSAHIARFDPETGTFLETLGGQGYGDGSSWSRGQGWILYGFTNAYRHTGNAAYLEAARKSAAYCIEQMQENDWLAPVDFRSPDKKTRMDSSAGVLLASGLLELAGQVADEEAQKTYMEAAYQMTRADVERFANWDTNTDGIMGGGSLRYHNDMLAGTSMIYSDYFLTEAICKMTGTFLEVW